MRMRARRHYLETDSAVASTSLTSQRSGNHRGEMRAESKRSIEGSPHPRKLIIDISCCFFFTEKNLMAAFAQKKNKSKAEEKKGKTVEKREEGPKYSRVDGR